MDAYVAKFSCLVFYCTPRTLSDIGQDFDREEAFEVEARLEVPEASSPLCALCRKRHLRTAFSDESLQKPALIRCCKDSVPAIEIGFSRLTLFRIHRFLGLRSKWASDGSPRPSDKLVTRYLEAFHDPFFSRLGNLYRLQSHLQVTETDEVILNSTMDISDYFRGVWSNFLPDLDKCGPLQDQIAALTKRLSKDPVEGGLHLCPHFALIETAVLEMIIEIWHELKAKIWDDATRQMTCKYCETFFKLRGDHSYWMMITIQKHLGTKADILKVEHAMNYPLLARHMSKRINVQYHRPYQRMREHHTRSKKQPISLGF